MPPKVSVCMITYNHEAYVAQAIESVMRQKTNFGYELVIGEDFSTDNTRQIVKRFQKKYPQKIRLILSEKNEGMMRNFIRTFQSCRGKYVAMLEGDDYWTKSNKLQKQVDFLDSNPQYSVCFHAIKAFYENNPKKTYLIPSKSRKKQTYSIENLLKQNFIATCSVMYRNNLVNKIPNWFYTIGLGDWPMHLLHAEHGLIGYLDEGMAKYRIHSKSGFSTRPKIKNFLDIIKMQETIDRYLGYKHHKIICEVVSQNYYLLAQEYLKNNNKTKAKIALKKAISAVGFLKSLKNIRLLQLFLTTLLSM